MHYFWRRLIAIISASAKSGMQRPLANKTKAMLTGIGTGTTLCGVLAYGSYISSENNTISCASARILDSSKAISNPSSLQSGYKEAKAAALSLTEKFKAEKCIPGICIAVEIDGELVWKQGFGFANVELGVHCTGDTVMRIASISKPIAATIAMQLVEKGVLDLDRPIGDYLPNYPRSRYQGSEVDITSRHLLSHLSGVRHYSKELGTGHEPCELIQQVNSSVLKPPKNETNAENDVKSQGDGRFPEFLNNKQYDSVTEALEIFSNDPLFFQPGTDFSYTTYGYVLLSAVLEAASGQSFPVLVNNLCHELDMRHTYLDENQPIIHNRASYYRVKNRSLVNVPQVNNSCKWAGGGILSNAADIAAFGSAQLYAAQWTNGCPVGILKQTTATSMWRPVARRVFKKTPHHSVGLGWFMRPACGLKTPMYAYHTGGAVGASSVLLVVPSKSVKSTCQPRGVVVSIITNLESINLLGLAEEVACLFENAARSDRLSLC